MKKSPQESSNQTKIHQPHDKFVKKLLSNYATAKEILSLYLPPDVLAITNLNKLELQRDSFIDDEHRTSAVDLLYKTEIKKTEGYIWILIEHQRKSDYWMPLRLFCYIGVIWDHIRRADTKRTTLPLVYPLVIYNGDTPYEHSLTLSDLLEPKAIKPIFEQLFTQPFSIVDLAKIKDDELRQQTQGHVRAAALLMALQQVYRRQLQTFFEEVLVSILKKQEQKGDSDAVVDVLYYLLSEGKFLENEEFKKIIRREFSQETEGKLMTIAQQIERKGMQKAMYLVAEELLKEGKRIDYIQKITKLKRKDILTLKEKLSH